LLNIPRGIESISNWIYNIFDTIYIAVSRIGLKSELYFITNGSENLIGLPVV
jgi:hypothetical protein